MLKKFLIVLLILVLLGGGAFAYWKWRYDEQPEAALLRTAALAMLGDQEGFLQGFTEDSRGLVGAVLNLSQGEDLSKSPRHPYYYLVTENIVGTERDSPTEARVRVRRPRDERSKGYDVPMVRTCPPKALLFDTLCLKPGWLIDGKKFDGRALDSQRDR